MDVLMVGAVVATVLIVVFIIIFNMMVSKKNTVNSAFASIDAMLKKRYDLIPNLVSVCEKYMKYESGVLKEITEIRTKFLHATEDERVQMDSGLAKQLKSVFAISERYPALLASKSFDMLQRSLNEVEEQIAASRRAYNATVMEYNNACQMFPTNIVASIMGYKDRAMFEASDDERKPVKVWR